MEQPEPAFEEGSPNPLFDRDGPNNENPKDHSAVDLDEYIVPQIGRDSPVDLNERDEEVAAAQSNILQAQAAGLHALLDDEPNLEPDEELPALVESQIEHVQLAQQFIEKISTATLDNGNLDDNVIERLRSPEEGPDRKSVV